MTSLAAVLPVVVDMHMHMGMMTTTMRTRLQEMREKIGTLVASGGAYCRFDTAGNDVRGWMVSDVRMYSGISVQNPGRQGAVPGGDLVQDLLRRAAECVLCPYTLSSI